MKRLHINRFVIGYLGMLLTLAVIGSYVSLYHAPSEVPKVRPQDYFSTDLTYYDLPRISMNMADADRVGHVNIDISLAVAKKDARRLDDFKSSITDRIVTYLDKQQLDQMRPPNDIGWLHRDILHVVNSSNQPIVIHDVVFRELVIM